MILQRARRKASDILVLILIIIVAAFLYAESSIAEIFGKLHWSQKPHAYCSSAIDQPLKRADGYWEGSIAECIIYDGKLNDQERRGVESFLYYKWISAGRENK